MKIVTIVGARPQFIKAAMVSKVLLHQEDVREVLLHTGQHYDGNMSQIFFDQMGIPTPDYNLEIGSGYHGETTGRMLSGVEAVLLKEKPDWVMVYGDTNSTLAGALAAAKLHIPVAHVEAGLRSFNKDMPEEINRILTDHVASLLFCPTDAACKNLAAESIVEGIVRVGDVMFDAALAFGDLADRESHILEALQLVTGQGIPEPYYLATVHRAENTDDPDCLHGILSAFNDLASEGCPVVLPLHPRTRVALLNHQIAHCPEGRHASAEDGDLVVDNPYVRIVAPASFLDMVQLEKNARVILTDSGGVQKEAYFHRVPCVTLRRETEWVETVEAGWNVLVGHDPSAILAGVRSFAEVPKEHPELYGDGRSAEKMVVELGRAAGVTVKA